MRSVTYTRTQKACLAYARQAFFVYDRVYRLISKSVGLAEGEARGSRQTKLETARNLLQFGLSIQKIAQATGLTVHEVEVLG